MKILIINGPNLNMLGLREKGVYGELTLDGLCADISDFCLKQGIDAEFFQSNAEGEIIDEIHSLATDKSIDGLVLNAGAYTHYSHAIGDALACIQIPKVEVHISNVHAREEFRNQSVLARSCNGEICGFGENSYKLACLAIKEIFEKAGK